MDGMSTSPTAGPFLDGTPEWDPSGNLWWIWCWSVETNTCVNRNAMSWNGTAFSRLGGAPQIIPSTIDNTLPFNNMAEMYPQSEFSIDASGTLFDTWLGLDNNQIWQIYVAETSSGHFLLHQVTHNLVQTQNALEAGSSSFIPSSASIVSMGQCTYIVYAEVFSIPIGTNAVPLPLGTVATQSCNDFASSSSSDLASFDDPNWGMNPDRDLLASGRVSFLFMNANDPQYGVSYVTDTTPGIGSLKVVDWYPSPN
jgi:hypothetical protein